MMIIRVEEGVFLPRLCFLFLVSFSGEWRGPVHLLSCPGFKSAQIAGIGSMLFLLLSLYFRIKGVNILSLLITNTQ